MSSFLKSSLGSDCETMYYQSPFKIPIPQSKYDVKNLNHGLKYLNYDADTENGDILPDDWNDYNDNFEDSKFFIFEIDL